jgi:uncharacterized protein
MSAKIRTEFPHQIREIENIFIPLSDGTRLAARIWLPDDAEQHPVPAILEYLPYRKTDDMAVRDSLNHPYVAGHGYACARVDIRGSGDSDGIMLDEYTKQEHDDALEVLQWLEQQPWCTGDVGMTGISWGGFNSLQIAALRPKQLKAIIPMGFTDDRYATDVHYQGGSLLAVDMLAWASAMLVYQARPPEPRFRDDWREMWLERLEHTPHYIEPWLSHQRRDDYWKHGSICENYSAIEIPVYAISGWGDSYSDSVLRTVAGLTCPKKALIGPWSHGFPHLAEPGPQIGFLQEIIRWWDYWLKGIDNGIMDEPMLRVWMQESLQPSTYYRERPGCWIAEETFPSPRFQTQQLYLHPDHTLTNQAGDGTSQSILGAQQHGLESGLWCPYGVPGDFPNDQRREDGLALCFDAETVNEVVDILGYPEVCLELSSNEPIAQVSARLCDISPTGESLLVSRGNLNLTHYKSHEFPEQLRAQQRYTVHFPLTSIAHHLQPGHHWRLALSPTYWNHLWPSPKPVTLTIYLTENSRLELPIRPERTEDANLSAFREPEISKPLETLSLRQSNRNLKLEHDPVTGQHTLTDTLDSGRDLLKAAALELEMVIKNRYTIREGSPLSARIECETVTEHQRGDWSIRVRTLSTLSSDETHFFVTNFIEAFEGDKRIFAKEKDFKIARDHL